jgi:hypothetical protein
MITYVENGVSVLAKSGEITIGEYYLNKKTGKYTALFFLPLPKSYQRDIVADSENASKQMIVRNYLYFKSII